MSTKADRAIAMLNGAAVFRRTSAKMTMDAVVAARDAGMTWEQISVPLGMTKAGAFAIGRKLLLTGEAIRTDHSVDMAKRMAKEMPR